MIQISTKELKEYLSLSNKVTSSGIIPILDYVKVELADNKAIFTKTNMRTYCIHEMDAVFEKSATILLDYKLLSTMVSKTTSPLITIKYDETKITLLDLDTTLACPAADVHDFPTSPEKGDGETTLLKSDVIDSIGLCRHYMSENESALSFCYVVAESEKSVVFATDRCIFYLKSFQQILPNMILDKEACSIICMFEEVQYFEAGNYDFFTSGRTTFGFVKTTHTPLPYHIVLGRNTDNISFYSKKKPIVNFCEVVASAVNSSTSIPYCVLKDSDVYIQLECAEPNVNIKTKIDAPGKSHDILDFAFNGRQMAKGLKNLPYDTLSFYAIQDSKGKAYMFKCEEDPGFVGLVQGFEI